MLLLLPSSSHPNAISSFPFNAHTDMSASSRNNKLKDWDQDGHAMERETKGNVIIPLNCVIQTKWPNASVNWNSSVPIL